jgi:hypothetical protein
MCQPKQGTRKAIEDVRARHEIHNWLAQTGHNQWVEKRRWVVTYEDGSSETIFTRTHLFDAPKKQPKAKA